MSESELDFSDFDVSTSPSASTRKSPVKLAARPPVEDPFADAVAPPLQIQRRGDHSPLPTSTGSELDFGNSITSTVASISGLRAQLAAGAGEGSSSPLDFGTDPSSSVATFSFLHSPTHERDRDVPVVVGVALTFEEQNQRTQVEIDEESAMEMISFVHNESRLRNAHVSEENRLRSDVVSEAKLSCLLLREQPERTTISSSQQSLREHLLDYHRVYVELSTTQRRQRDTVAAEQHASFAAIGDQRGSSMKRLLNALLTIEEQQQRALASAMLELHGRVQLAAFVLDTESLQRREAAERTALEAVFPQHCSVHWVFHQNVCQGIASFDEAKREVRSHFFQAALQQTENSEVERRGALVEEMNSSRALALHDFEQQGNNAACDELQRKERELRRVVEMEEFMARDDLTAVGEVGAKTAQRMKVLFDQEAGKRQTLERAEQEYYWDWSDQRKKEFDLMEICEMETGARHALRQAAKHSRHLVLLGNVVDIESCSRDAFLASFVQSLNALQLVEKREKRGVIAALDIQLQSTLEPLMRSTVAGDERIEWHRLTRDSQKGLEDIEERVVSAERRQRLIIAERLAQLSAQVRILEFSEEGDRRSQLEACEQTVRQVVEANATSRRAVCLLNDLQVHEAVARASASSQWLSALREANMALEWELFLRGLGWMGALCDNHRQLAYNGEVSRERLVLSEALGRRIMFGMETTYRDALCALSVAAKQQAALMAAEQQVRAQLQRESATDRHILARCAQRLQATAEGEATRHAQYFDRLRQSLPSVIRFCPHPPPARTLPSTAPRRPATSADLVSILSLIDDELEYRSLISDEAAATFRALITRGPFKEVAGGRSVYSDMYILC